MSNFIKTHLQQVNTENLLEFQQECFLSMCSCSSRKGTVNLGCSANGQFLVKRRNETWRYKNPNQAIEKYKELLENHLQ